VTLAAEARLSASVSQQLEQVDRARRAGRLQHEHFLPADVFLDLDLHLAVAERTDLRLAQRHTQTMGDILGSVRCALPVNSIIGVDVSTVVTSEPADHHEWLGRQDSNLRMRESKSRALTSLATPQ
jgi:hypothetical protein